MKQRTRMVLKFLREELQRRIIRGITCAAVAGFVYFGLNFGVRQIFGFPHVEYLAVFLTLGAVKVTLTYLFPALAEEN